MLGKNNEKDKSGMPAKSKGKEAGEKLKAAWEKLTPEQKKRVVWFSLIATVIILALGAYSMKTKSNVVAQKGVDGGKKEVTMDQHLLEKSAYLEGKKELSKMRDEIQQLGKQIKTPGLAVGKDGKPLPVDPKTGNVRTQPETGVQLFNQNQPQQIGLPGLPNGTPGQMPSTPNLPQPTTVLTKNAPPAVEEKEESIGGIESTSNSYKVHVDSQKEGVKKKRTVYLPPSFMAATLLSGLDAPASANAKSHPMPALLRIKDMAFLPNNIKQNLKGCFVIAEGTGNLADERAHLRLVTLSCLSKRGKSVINSPIKGFVVDESGKIGIRGTVVSKMGSVIVRSILAGFVAGFGDAFKQSTTITSISPLGQTQTLDPDKLVKAGIGQGVSQAAQEIQKFYLDLARQTVPVIEIGATRELTLVVSDGAELEIKDIGNMRFATR